jgi:hypothetical protein
LLNETTPYSTPCATSPYYTPQSSPTRGNGWTWNENGLVSVVDWN